MRDIGEQAPPVVVADDVWRRGRRARVRDTVVAPVAALVLALLALSLWQVDVPASREFPPADQAPSTSPALPTTLYSVPDWVDEPTTDLAVGPVSALWLENGHGHPVAVSATDGSYRLLRLPGFDAREAAFVGEFAAPEGAVLSPDGRRVAYWWHEPPGGGDPVPSGVRVADLETGEVESFPIDDGAGVFVSGISWSADGRYLTAVVMAQESWTETRSSGRLPTYASRLDTGTGSWVRWRASGETTVAMSPDGGRLVYPAGRDGLIVTRAEDGKRRGYRAVGFGDAESIVWSPDGRSIAYLDRGQSFTLRLGGEATSTVADLGREARQVLGWNGPAPSVWYKGGEGGLIAPGETALHGLGDITWLSVATGLLNEPRADFAQPDWPMDPVWKAAGLSAIAMAVLIGILVWWRRRGA